MTKDEEALKMALEALGDIARARSSGFGIDYAEGYATTTIKQLRKALAEPDMPIDRGNWSGVPDATKWVDELRGGDDFEEPPNSATDVVEPETKRSQELFGKTEQLEAEIKRLQEREWVGLTDEELEPLCDEWRIIFGAHVNVFAREIESKLKEKNCA